MTTGSPGDARARRKTEAIAAAIAEDIGKEVNHRDVETDGARKAAARIAKTP